MRISLTSILIYHLKHINKNGCEVCMVKHCCKFTFPPTTMLSLQEVFVPRVPYFTQKTVKAITITCDFLMQNWPQPILRLFKPSLLGLPK